MRKYRIGFAVYNGKGFSTHNRNIQKYALHDPEIDMIWSPIGDDELPAHYRYFPHPIPSVLALLREAAPILRSWDQLDAIVVEDAPILLALLTLRKLLFDRKKRAPVLILYQDYAPLKDTSLLAWYGYSTSRESLSGRTSYFFQQWFARRADICVLFSKWAKDIMVHECGVAEERVHVVPPGSDLELWQHRPKAANPSEKPQILFVGGDFRRKGGDLLLKTYAEHFAGIAELNLVTKQAPADVPPGVHLYTDMRSNDPRLQQLYEQCDVFALPTRADFSPLAAIEAMALGRPVISTRVGGIPEIVRDGETGFIIQPDDEAALKETLHVLLTNGEMRRQMGANGRDTVEREFNIEANVAQLLSIIKVAVDQRDHLATSVSGLIPSNPH